MNKKLKDFVKSKPLLSRVYRRIFRGNILRPTYKKHIIGVGNYLNIDNSAMFTHCKFDIIGNNNEIIINNATSFSNVTFYIRGNNNKIVISRNVKYNKGGSLWMEDENGEIRIGEYTTFEDAHLAVTEPKSKIIIGDDCMFANDIDVRTGDSHSIMDTTTNKRINYAQDVMIGNHVWIASHVSILKGVTISPNSVVATRSVVTKNFNQENVLLVGIPAKILKENINWDRRRINDR